jgi:DNA-binding response OmpR family regulator
MKPASILVTDDESGIRLMLKTALESDGYSVLEAANGQQALDVMKSRTPDLVVLDLNMPVLDGMAVLEAMKSLAAAHKPRVIILTAYGSIPAAVKATRLGALDFLEKPVTPSELRQTVRSVLDEPELNFPPNVQIDSSGFQPVLDRIRRTLRLADYSTAEAMLMKAADRQHEHSAEYFNLLGVLYEAQRKWRLARKCYEKALTSNDDYEPAKANLRRLIELQSHGQSSQAIVLGDEPDDVWFAKMPPSQN